MDCYAEYQGYWLSTFRKNVPPVYLIKDFWKNSRCEGQVQIFNFYLYGLFDIPLGSLTLEDEVGTLLRSVRKTMLFIVTV